LIFPKCLTIKTHVERLVDVVHVDFEWRDLGAKDVQGNGHNVGKEEHHLSEGPVKVPGETKPHFSFLFGDSFF